MSVKYILIYTDIKKKWGYFKTSPKQRKEIAQYEVFQEFYPRSYF